MEILEKLSKIQAIIERTSSEGERQAAVLAMERLLQQQKQQPKEYRITVRSIWQKNLFVALCKKYGLKTYRYHRQKYTTTMVRIVPAFLDELLWPEYRKYSDMLQELIQDVLNTVLAKVNIDNEETIILGELEHAHEIQV